MYVPPLFSLSNSDMAALEPWIKVHPEVVEALKLARPVVALESTVITHGLPRPHNIALAKALETTVRDEGAVPATIAVIAGKLTIGLTEAELTTLANTEVAKASLWNLSSLLAQRASAGTTVATTLHGAYQAGIQVFATGGIGGVHRQPFDESADLMALARYPLVTVCAGAKSILDLAATKERLESYGVPLIGYQTAILPGFHVPETPHAVAAQLQAPEEVARALAAQKALGLMQGLVVAQPMDGGVSSAQLELWIAQAQEEAESENLSGKDITPYLLARLAELSEGLTVEINIALLKNNAKLSAKIARAIIALTHDHA